MPAYVLPLGWICKDCGKTNLNCECQKRLACKKCKEFLITKEEDSEFYEYPRYYGYCADCWDGLRFKDLEGQVEELQARITELEAREVVLVSALEAARPIIDICGDVYASTSISAEAQKQKIKQMGDTDCGEPGGYYLTANEVYHLMLGIESFPVKFSEDCTQAIDRILSNPSPRAKGLLEVVEAAKGIEIEIIKLALAKSPNMFLMLNNTLQWQLNRLLEALDKLEGGE